MLRLLCRATHIQLHVQPDVANMSLNLLLQHIDCIAWCFHVVNRKMTICMWF